MSLAIRTSHTPYAGGPVEFLHVSHLLKLFCLLDNWFSYTATAAMSSHLGLFSLIQLASPFPSFLIEDSRLISNWWDSHSTNNNYLLRLHTIKSFILQSVSRIMITLKMFYNNGSLDLTYEIPSQYCNVPIANHTSKKPNGKGKEKLHTDMKQHKKFSVKALP